MNWKREQPGLYTAGPYRVERRDRYWFVTGPGIGTSHHNYKDDAQAVAERAATVRAADPDANAPVVGDIVEVPGHDGRRGQVSMIMAPRGNQNELAQQALWCILFTRGRRRLCLFRHEIKVVVP